MAVDHDRARELHATSLRALMEDRPPTETMRLIATDMRDVGGFSMDANLFDHASDWIDAVCAAWERGER